MATAWVQARGIEIQPAGQIKRLILTKMKETAEANLGSA